MPWLSAEVRSRLWWKYISTLVFSNQDDTEANKQKLSRPLRYDLFSPSLFFNINFFLACPSCYLQDLSCIPYFTLFSYSTEFFIVSQELMQYMACKAWSYRLFWTMVFKQEMFQSMKAFRLRFLKTNPIWGKINSKRPWGSSVWEWFVATDELQLPSGEPEFKFMNLSSARVPWVFQAEGLGLRLLLSPNRALPRTWTHVSCFLFPLSLPKEERHAGRGEFLLMPLELHLSSNSWEVDAKLYSPKYGQSQGSCFLGISAWRDAFCSHFLPKGLSLATHLNIQRFCSLGSVWAVASPAWIHYSSW